MFKYILKRIGYMVITMFVIATITFFLMHNIQGSPIEAMGRNLPKQTIENYREKYGLDKPVTEQYTIFLKNAITKGDLGASYKYPGREVSSIIKETSPISGRVGAQALILGIVIGTTFGIIAALKRDTWPDYVVSIIAVLGVTVPMFIIAAILQYFLSVKAGILPTSGWGSFKYTVIPTIAMSFATIATYARYIRSNMLEEMGKDYVLTAEAKGVSNFNIIRKHVLRNAILPVITLLGSQIAGVFTGSFIIEKIFGIPGLGFYYVSAITDRDYPMIIGTTIFYAAIFLVSQLLVDILYGVVDPRIRVANTEGR
ncbi:ABC transporter permease [Miniphocaeibacter massiliensis]|uniref:ABC transporter permease n=1 Tax=Miniphocaeibacter massiliensis TaxID=2041841 RepID=UPI000C1B8A2D|nr:ABC transporter permease [Miniphocaeibacter massiliensis]